MRLWNLSSFDKLEPPVLTSTPSHARPRTRERVPEKHRTSQVRFALRVAALTAISYTIAVSGTSTVIAVQSSDVQSISSNFERDRPPLDVMFGGRFDAEWSASHEEALLNEALKKSSGSVDRDLQNLIHTSQQESLSEDVPRLTEREVLKIIRRKV